MRIAFFTVLSPIQSAIADHSEGLALAMSKLPGVTVDLFVDDNYRPDNPVIISQLRVSPYQEFEPRARQYDVCLYAIGSHTYHTFELSLVRRYPGVVILHDLTLHHLIMQSLLGKGDVQAYLDEVQYASGIPDLRIADQMRLGLGDQLALDYPLFERIVDNSRGIIVHNQYARSRVLAKRPKARVQCILQPFFMPPGFPDYDLTEQRARQRAEMELESRLVIGSFGILAPSKHLESCLSAFARIAHKYPRSRYVLGGFPVAGYDLPGYIREMGLDDHVTITGWLPPPEFARCMFALDVGVHLRYPHIGGTPYTPIRLMGLGVCTIVSDIEPLAELPQGACVKIAPDEYQEDTLAAVLEYLADHPELRQQISRNGQQFVARHHDIDQIARQYVDFMQQVM